MPNPLNGEKIVSSTTEFPHAKKMKSDPPLHPIYKINTKWINNPNVRGKTTQLLVENIGINIHNLGFVKGFLDVTPKA